MQIYFTFCTELWRNCAVILHLGGFEGLLSSAFRWLNNLIITQ